MPAEFRPTPAHLTEDALEEYFFGRLAEPYLTSCEEHLLSCRPCLDALEQTGEFIRLMKQGVALQMVAAATLAASPAAASPATASAAAARAAGRTTVGAAEAGVAGTGPAGTVPAGTGPAAPSTEALFPQTADIETAGTRRFFSRRVRLATAGAGIPFLLRPAMLAAAMAAILLVAGLAWRTGALGTRETSGPPVAVALAALRGAEPASGAQAPARRPLDLVVDRTRLSTGRVREGYEFEVVDPAGRQVWRGAAGELEDPDRLVAHLPQGLPEGSYWVRLYLGRDELLREFGLRIR